MLLIAHGNVVSMEGADYPNGYLIIKEGKIAEVGPMEALSLPESAFDTVYDAADRTVLPGFVDAHCHVGLFGEGLGAEGEDGNEDTDPITPQLRAIDGINPFDEAFFHARHAGVTTVVTGPGSANVLAGEFAALKTMGVCVDDMVVRAPVAQKMALGENPKMVYGGKEHAPATRMATAALIRETLQKAFRYQRDLQAYRNDPEGHDEPELDMKLESLLPVVRREIPLKVHAHRADDIFTALRIAREFQVKITLEHCTEGYLIADAVRAAGVPVSLGPTLGNKSKPELQNLSFEIYRVFGEKGIPFAITTDHPEIPIQFLPLCAALAVRSGLDRRTALEAITIVPARNAGIADRVGSLKAGKDADVVVVEGDILALDGRVAQVWIDGKAVRD